jgi:hypothetical protein
MSTTKIQFDLEKALEALKERKKSRSTELTGLPSGDLQQ